MTPEEKDIMTKAAEETVLIATLDQQRHDAAKRRVDLMRQLRGTMSKSAIARGMGISIQRVSQILGKES